MELNVNSIINTPDKILRRAYDGLKSNYTKAGAIEYYNVYSKMPLSVILANAKLIYAEPYKGYEFITNLVQNSLIPIAWYERLKGMVDTTISEYTDKISVEQMNTLKSLSQRLQMKDLQFRGIRPLMKFVSKDLDAADDKIMEVYGKVYTDNRAGLDSVEELAGNLDTLPDYMRIMLAAHNGDKVVKAVIALRDPEDVMDRLEGACNKVHLANFMSRLMRCDYFNKHINALPMNQRHELERTAAHDSEVVTDQELTVRDSINEAYSNPAVLISAMYENAINDPEISSVFEESRNENLMIEKAMLDIDAAYLANDYVNNPDGLYEESCLGDSISSQAMLKELTTLMERSDELDSLITCERRDDMWSPNSESEVEKPQKVKESLSRRIQNAGLDADIRYKKAAASARQKTQGVRNAAKAVAKVPKNITDEITDAIEDFDNADDERRKKYIAEPGFRKKYWRWLKLAIAHLLAFKIHPIINIILFIATKLGGEKNKRIRNELITELQTEIAVIEQKIEDAKSDARDGEPGSNSRKAVYKLMRMRDKLKQELTRISTNSKNI